ncbi:nucleotidyl transferase AbiEii/AbiGii toxin family protein [Reyranella sp. CPCC 100927]|uniref:nucleotidyl transferase AbiEii/AbiGii toxin family protein n=1 Tax=Reyranella sp. CPCC 100927 TaxID=2599616 RepID=UPI0011B65F08|nr:nucleotidyl transferase AbiEii/AbiGii toxin family protein [Reyranella sp. CPCC 100927]TWT11528.1 nucleotidyl transferase AbiEii/AbiGii toxin family protein [Reyranella sp. CPCC 100927]
MREPPRDMGASVRARLLKIATERNQPFDLILTRYALERLLFRLSTTSYRERFILKGATLMAAWFDTPFRPTRDIDFLGFGDSDPEAALRAFQEICAIENNDGVVFDVERLAVDRIREELEYGGLRITTIASIGGARSKVVIDIGFGDATEPGIADLKLPVLLDLPAPRLRAYPRETVIAEKFQAMVMLGRDNSRMKDFYDIWMLSRSYEFDSDRLAQAIAATFARRKTTIPTDLPDALTRDFAEDPAKRKQWTSFVEAIAMKPGSLLEIVEALATFLMSHAAAARRRGA